MTQTYAIVQGNVQEILSQFPENFFHGVLTDPPYGYCNIARARLQHWCPDAREES